MNKEQIEPAQLEKAPEPVAEVEELNQGFNDGLLHVKWNVKPLIGMKLYTSPPEVAELQPEIERLVALNDKLRANEQKLIDDKFELQKQVQALQAEIERLKNEVPDDPMDWRLPCSVTVGHGTIGKGCKLRTLVMRMQVLYEMAHEVKKS